MIQLLNIDCMEYMKGCEDNAFDLAIVDPPYFETKGEFDFIWSSFDDYLLDVDKWAMELKRILKDSASMFWWGNSKKIAYTQIIVDKYFNLENSLIWEKKDSIQYQYYSPELARCFNTHNERVLYYSCEIGITGREFIEKNYIAPRNPFAKELRKARLKKGVSINQVAEYGKFYGNINHGGSVTNWENGYNVPLKEQWGILCNHLPIEKTEYDELRKEYNELRKEYEDLRRPFYNSLKLTEVLSFSQQSSETSRHNHPTQKAPKLTEALLRVTGKSGGRAFIPFAGSGTELIACYKVGMDVVGCELDKDYYDAAKARFNEETKQESLF